METGGQEVKMKKYVNVRVTYESEYFELEIDDGELKEAEQYGIDIEDDEELVKFHLESNFNEHVDLLSIEDYEYEVEDK